MSEKERQRNFMFNSSVQFSCSVMSNSLQPHEPQHTRPPCPSPTPGVHLNPCPLSQWCHPTISSSVIPFFSCPQSFPVSESFQMSQLFASGDQNIGVSASTSVLPMNSSVQFSRSVISDSLLPHEWQHTRPPCPSPTPGVYSNSSPLSRWCHPTISSSVIPFFSHPQSFPASGPFQMSQLFASGGQSIGISASVSVLPMTIQGWCLLGWTGLISLLSKGLSRVFSNTTVQKHQFFSDQPSLWANSHIHTWLLEKLKLWIYEPLLAK